MAMETPYHGNVLPIGNASKKQTHKTSVILSSLI